jgi:hypothetical protein
MSGTPMIMSWTEISPQDHPPLSGWYAVLRCWEPEEGVFPDAVHWPSDDWDVWIVRRSPKPFASHGDALDWAYENDPEL